LPDVYALLIHGWAHWVVNTIALSHAVPYMFDLMYCRSAVDNEACAGGR
jgi:hypothetical protein